MPYPSPMAHLYERRGIGEFVASKLSVNTHQGSLRELEEYLLETAKHIRTLADLADDGKIKVSYAEDGKIYFKGDTSTLYKLDKDCILSYMGKQSISDL
jgi:hypothetical protein